MNSQLILAIFIFVLTNSFHAQDQIDPISPLAKKNIEKFLQSKDIQIEILKYDAKNSTRFYGNFYGLKNNNISNYCFIGRIKSCRAQGCDLQVSITNTDEFEFFDYYIIFDYTGIVLQSYVFNYEASHGHEIMVKKWLQQFNGFNGNTELILGKNIDAISGATISADNITKDIYNRTRELKAFLQTMHISERK